MIPLPLFSRYFFALFLASTRCFADGLGVDKVYTPYVEEMARDIEYRLLAYTDKQQNNKAFEKHQLSFGKTLGEKWFGEVYVTGIKKDNGEMHNDGFALESKWQLSEQGEYRWDSGLLVEVESENNNKSHEISTALLLARQFQRLVLTTNLFLIIEDLPDKPLDMEMALNSQLKYRWNAAFEPAIEMYLGQVSSAIGPVVMGDARLNATRWGMRKKLHWELGYIWELKDDLPDHILRAMAELEF